MTLPFPDLERLVGEFRACSLPRDAWTHVAHLAVGAWHVHRYGADALTHLRAGIRRLNEHHGTPNSPTHGYHETITRAYVQLLSEFLDGTSAEMSLVEQIAQLVASPLAAKDVLLRFYSRETLMAERARAEWVEPDIAPLRLDHAAVDVVGFRDEFAPAFEALNRAWIERSFAVEAPDAAVFADPRREIVDRGGQILFVLDGHDVVGTCALIPRGAGTVELAKMAVAERVRGRGLGDRPLAAAIRWARNAGAERLTLVSNSTLVPALRLYEKHGFRHVPVDAGNHYTRADVQMQLDL